MKRLLQNSATTFFALSLVFHAGVAIVLAWTAKSTPPTPTPIVVEYQDARPAPQFPAPRPERIKAVDVQRKQIVEQQKRINDEIDERSRRLSAFDQKVIKETRAQNNGKFSNRAEEGRKREAQQHAEKKIAKTKPTAPGELPSLQALSPKFVPDETAANASADKSGEASQTDDYLKDVATGMQTLLSTREFVYYSYYNRIKEALRQHWEPDVRERVRIFYRQGRALASAKDRVTQVLVTLDARGELVNVQVLGQSGVLDLDGAAVDAFKQAAPFPNPPKGMIEGDGTVRIRWDFVLEV